MEAAEINITLKIRSRKELNYWGRFKIKRENKFIPLYWHLEVDL
jgi:hypothetical protein